jgi:hypothetical protein
MALLPLISLLMIAVLLMSMMAQSRPWMKLKITGKVIKTLPLSFIERVKFHRSTLMAMAMGLFIGRVSGWLPASIALFAGSFALAILFMPMKYTFTTQGVAVGQAIFRPWKEFTNVEKKPNQIVLYHPAFFGRFSLSFKPAELENVLMVIEKSNR